MTPEQLDRMRRTVALGYGLTLDCAEAQRLLDGYAAVIKENESLSENLSLCKGNELAEELRATAEQRDHLHEECLRLEPLLADVTKERDDLLKQLRAGEAKRDQQSLTISNDTDRFIAVTQLAIDIAGGGTSLEKALERLAAMAKELAKWQQPFDSAQFQHAKEQASHGDSLAAQRVYITALEHAYKHAAKENGTLKDACRQHLTMLENAVKQLVQLKFEDTKEPT